VQVLVVTELVRGRRESGMSERDVSASARTCYLCCDVVVAAAVVLLAVVGQLTPSQDDSPQSPIA